MMLDFDDLKRLPESKLRAAWILRNPGIENGITLRSLTVELDIRLIMAYYRAAFMAPALDGCYHFFIENSELATRFLPPNFQMVGVQVYDYGSLPKLVKYQATRILDVSVLRASGNPISFTALDVLVSAVSDRHTFKLL